MTLIAPAYGSELVTKLARALRRDVAREATGRIAHFVGLVAAWNARIDLTAAREPTALVEVLVADALILADEQLVPRGVSLVDVGAGAGAPTLPLLLLRDDVSATLVEPLRKRVAFMRTATGELDLAARAKVVETRVDPEAPSVDGASFDVALSRATLAPELWLKVGCLLAPRVLVLTAAGPAPACPPMVRVAHEVEYAVPSTGAPRRITAYEVMRAR